MEYSTFGIAAAGAILGFLLLGRRMANRHRRFVMLKNNTALIGAAMERYGITPADVVAAGLGGDIYAASNRCATCASTEPCRAWLASGSRKPFERTCPNLRLFEEVRAHKRVREANRVKIFGI